MAKTIIGTSYFPGMWAARRYYAYENATREDIERKIAEGLIHIGRPPVKEGQTIKLIDCGQRYAIVEG